MTELCRLTIPVDPNLTSLNRRYHWTRMAKAKKSAYDTARWCWENLRRTDGHLFISPTPVRVSLIVRRGRVIDNDNIVSGMKPIMDALFNHAITPSDSAAWVTLGDIKQETGKKYGKNPEVLVIVETLE